MRLRARLWAGISTIALGAATNLAATNTAHSIDPHSLERGGGDFAVQLAAGEGGEGGEGGEAGVDADAAATDPVVYLTALDVIRAHYLAGLASVQAGRRASGGEMFAHPIAEIYVDLEPTFRRLGVAPFMDQMVDATELALGGATDDEIEKAARAVLSTLEAAESNAPADSRSALAIQIAVLADMLDRAALQYQVVATSPDSGEAWLDGFGFYKAAADRAERIIGELGAVDDGAAQGVRDAISLCEQAYPGPIPPDILPVDAGALLAASSRVKLQSSGL